MRIPLFRCMILFFLCFSILSSKCQTTSKNSAIAVVVKVRGSQGNISDVSFLSQKEFNGRVKNDFQNLKTENSLHIIVRDENNNVLYDDYLENPLNRMLESVDEKGKIERLQNIVKEEFINIRLNYPAQTRKLRFNFLKVLNEKENDISTFNISLR